MRILGIDPGLEVTGYGVVEQKKGALRLVEAGIVESSQKDSLEKRLFNIHRGIRRILSECRPDFVVLEELYSHYRHPRTAILMGHARGIVLSACSESNLPTKGYSAKRIRQAVTGSGNASKEQVQRMIQTLLGLHKKSFPLDVSDALALAVGYVYLNGGGIPGGTKSPQKGLSPYQTGPDLAE